MPLNSSKLDAIRAKLTAENPILQTTATTVTEPKKEINAPATAIAPPKDVQAGKASVNSSLVKLEATAVSNAKASIVRTEPVETAGTINFQRISDSVSQLAEAIYTAHPRMPQLLHDIWSTLHKYPEQVTLLSEEQMEVVFSGLEKIVDTDLAALTIKGAMKSGGKKQAVTTASLGF